MIFASKMTLSGLFNLGNACFLKSILQSSLSINAVCGLLDSCTASIHYPPLTQCMLDIQRGLSLDKISVRALPMPVTG